MTISLRWFPQSWVQIRTDAHIVYIDPSNVVTAGEMLASTFSSKVRIDKLPENTGPGDLVMITHHHLDHVRRGLVEHLSSPGAKVLAPSRCEKKLSGLMDTVRAGDIVTLADLTVRVVEAYNPVGSRPITFHRKGEGVGYVIETEGKRLYHAGDTGLIDEMNELGPIDIAFLPIGGKFTLDIGEAVEAVKRIKPEVVVPMHMLKADPNDFKARVEGETTTRVRVLPPGGLTMCD